jgi:hypothetical protein
LRSFDDHTIDITQGPSADCLLAFSP